MGGSFNAGIQRLLLYISRDCIRVEILAIPFTFCCVYSIVPCPWWVGVFMLVLYWNRVDNHNRNTYCVFLSILYSICYSILFYSIQYCIIVYSIYHTIIYSHFVLLSNDTLFLQFYPDKLYSLIYTHEIACIHLLYIYHAILYRMSVSAYSSVAWLKCV